jgi:hypothetical protein
MSEERDMHVAAATARARAAMAVGATLDDVLRTFRTHDQLSTIESIKALFDIAPIGLGCAKVIVCESDGGRNFAHLTLADLDLLADASSVKGVDSFIRSHRQAAIIERKPYLLYVRNHRIISSVYVHASTIPLETPPTHLDGSMSGQSITFERVCEDVRKAATAWPIELRILRDEPDQLLLHFLRAPPAS